MPSNPIPQSVVDKDHELESRAGDGGVGEAPLASDPRSRRSPVPSALYAAAVGQRPHGDHRPRQRLRPVR